MKIVLPLSAVVFFCLGVLACFNSWFRVTSRQASMPFIETNEFSQGLPEEVKQVREETDQVSKQCNNLCEQCEGTSAIWNVTSLFVAALLLLVESLRLWYARIARILDNVPSSVMLLVFALFSFLSALVSTQLSSQAMCYRNKQVDALQNYQVLEQKVFEVEDQIAIASAAQKHRRILRNLDSCGDKQ